MVLQRLRGVSLVFGGVVEPLKGLLLYCFGAGAGAAGWLLAGVAA